MVFGRRCGGAAISACDNPQPAPLSRSRPMKWRRRVGWVGLVVVLAGLPAWLYAQYRLHVGPLADGQAAWFEEGALAFQLATLAAVGLVLFLAARQYTICDPRDAEFMREVGPSIVGGIFATPFWVLGAGYDVLVRPS